MDISRITIEVGGYRWRFHGKKVRGKFRSDLVELLGYEGLDIPLNRKLQRELRRSLATFLRVEVEDVNPITADLILV